LLGEIVTLEIYGLPNEVEEEQLNKIYEGVKEKITDNKELKVKPKQVAVFFIPDMMKLGLGNEIIIRIKDLLDDEKRTTAMLHSVVESVGEFLVQFTHEWPWKKPKYIAVALEIFNNPSKKVYWINENGGKFYKLL